MKKFDLMKGKLEEWTKSGSLCCSWLILGWEFNVSFEVVSRLILHGIRTEFMKILAYILTLGKFFSENWVGLWCSWAWFLHKFIKEARFWCSWYNLEATYSKNFGLRFSWVNFVWEWWLGAKFNWVCICLWKCFSLV